MFMLPLGGGALSTAVSSYVARLSQTMDITLKTLLQHDEWHSKQTQCCCSFSWLHRCMKHLPAEACLFMQ